MAAAVAVLAPAAVAGGGGGGVVRHGGADEDGRDGEHGIGGLRREADFIACIQNSNYNSSPRDQGTGTAAGLRWDF